MTEDGSMEAELKHRLGDGENLWNDCLGIVETKE